MSSRCTLNIDQVGLVNTLNIIEEKENGNAFL